MADEASANVKCASQELPSAKAEPPGIVEGLFSKQNTKVFIWKHFGFSTDGSGRPCGNPKCRLCRTEVLEKNSNMSNLHSYLLYKHPEEHSIVQAATGTKGKKPNDDRVKQPSLETMWDKTKILSVKFQEYRRLTKSVTFCLDTLPISTVDKLGFREMLHTFNPRYRLPSRNHFTNVAVPELVVETRSNIENQISDGDISHFATCGHQQLEILT